MEKANKLMAVCVVLSIFLLSTMYSGIFLVIISETLLLLAAIIGLKVSAKNLNRKTLLFTFLLFMYLFIVSLVSQTIQDNIITTILLFSQIFFVMTIVDSDQDRVTVKLVYKYFSKIMVVLAVYSIIVYIFGSKTQVYNGNIDMYVQNWNIFGVTLSQSSLGGDQLGTINVGSILSNPNTLSYFALIALYIVAFSKKKMVAKISSSIILLIAIYISGSRLAVVLACFIPLMIFYGRFGRNGKTKKAVFAVLTILLMLICAVNMSQVVENINFNGRLERWQAGIENMSIFGHGLKTDEAILNEEFGYDTAMHNSYIAMLDNFGIIMTTMMIVLLLFIIGGLIKNNKNKKYRIELSILFILMIASMSESIVFFVSGYNILFFMTIFSAVNINTRLNIGESR